jgi:hypothetical protein
MHSGNGTSVQIGNLGVVESTPPNNTKPDISTGNYQPKHGHHSLQFMAWWFFYYHFQEFRKNFGIWFRGKNL